MEKKWFHFTTNYEYQRRRENFGISSIIGSLVVEILITLTVVRKADMDSKNIDDNNYCNCPKDLIVYRACRKLKPWEQNSQLIGRPIGCRFCGKLKKEDIDKK